MTTNDKKTYANLTKKIYVKTYGCQMNVYDSLRMQDLMQPFGYEVTDEMDYADLVILNTCHIREKAAEKLYSELGRIRQAKMLKAERGEGDMVIAVAGCVAQAEGDYIFERAPYVNVIVGPQSYHSLPELVARIHRKENHLLHLDFIEEKKFDNLPTNVSYQGTSAFVSIQEGCDKFCAFCVVPYTRGAEFSRPFSQVYREVLSAVSNGSKEVVLLGQNVNAYHGHYSDTDNNNKATCSLAGLIEHLAQIDGLERIRYMTSHPRDMSDDLIKIHGLEPKLMPFLHLPIQSGSNKILHAMNRKHTREEYLEIIARLREERPDIALSSDFIVGFPGETDEDFADTVDIVRKVGYAQCFSFKYSPRPGTPASIKIQVPEEIKTERLRVLQDELFKQQFEFNQRTVGRVVPVLFEKDGKYEHQIVGRTPYMQLLHIHNASKDLLNKIANVRVTEAFPTSLGGIVIREHEFA